MSKFIENLLSQLAGTAVEEQPAVIRQALVDSGADLDKVRGEIADYASKDQDGTPEALERLETVARIHDAVTEQLTQAAERADRIKQLAESLRTPVEEPTPEVEAPADPVAEVQAEAPAPVLEPALKAREAIAGPIPLNAFTSNAPSDEGEQRGGFEKFSLEVAGNVNGYVAGQKLDGLHEFAKAWIAKVGSLRTNAAEPTRFAVGQIRRELPESHTVREGMNRFQTQDVLDFAASEKQLPGGSLVAAGGWCAPSERLYDLCPIKITNEGLISLPTVSAPRGGIEYPAAFDWASLWGHTGDFSTEAQMIAGKTKPCIEIPCPADWVECRMDVHHLCIKHSLLMQKGWPEWVAQFTEGALKVWAHELNAAKLAKMESLATVVPPFTRPDADPGAAIVDPHGPGLIERTMSILEMLVTHERYKNRLSQGATLEMILPAWVKGVFKSDLRKKLGIENRWSVTDATVDSYFRSVGVNVQYVYDWQDAYADADDTGVGGAIPANWPGTVKALIYPAGAYYQLAADVISVDAITDFASLQANMTGMFVEEGWQVCLRCDESYLIELPLCPDGLSGSHQSVNCAAPTP